MELIYLRTSEGFLCGDLESGRTAYAYPSSIHARDAVRNPVRVATEMLKQENASRYPADLAERFSLQHKRRLDAMLNNMLAVQISTITI